MPSHVEQRILPYKPAAMFDLVADIERYPEFLPWCQTAVIRKKMGNRVVADLAVGTKLLNDNLTTSVMLERPDRIAVSYVQGPLTHLSNEWRFAAVKGGACKISFYVDFSFRSPVLGAMMNAVFDKAFRKMAQAFEERARDVYG